MPAPLLIVPAGIGIAVSKKAENKRRQAASNEFSKRYPLLDDLGSMESSLASAKLELKKLNSMAANTAGAKRVKARNTDLLNKWTLVMSSHIKDLKAGMNMASSQVAPVPAQATVAPVVAQEEAPAPAQTAGEEISAEAPKKGVNWLLIGGVAVGAFLIYKLIKK
jgi:hypothetical protein